MKESRSKTEPVYKLLQDNLVCREKKLKEKKNEYSRSWDELRNLKQTTKQPRQLKTVETDKLTIHIPHPARPE